MQSLTVDLETQAVDDDHEDEDRDTSEANQLAQNSNLPFQI